MTPSTQSYVEKVYETKSSIKRPFIGGADTYDIKLKDEISAGVSATVFTNNKVNSDYQFKAQKIRMKAVLDSAITTTAGAMALLATALYF